MNDLEELRPQLAAHDCEWLIDAGADLEACRDAIVYLDAKEEGRTVDRPPLEAIAIVNREGVPHSLPVMLAVEPTRIVIDLSSGIRGYRISSLDGVEMRLFGEHLRTNMVLTLVVHRGGRVELERLAESTAPASSRPRVNLLGVQRVRPRMGEWIRRLLR